MKISHLSPFTTSLIRWYIKEKRDLPWRNSLAPYRVWLSEVMLQQTQVDTVIPYYNRWLESCPDLQCVAEKNIQEILTLWEGLGYYSRCRNFYSAVKEVVKNHGGNVPSEWKQFRALPGVGDYTAAAVMSIAFHKPLPAIDGNVYRVMARVLGIKHLTPYNKNRIKNRLEKWIDTDHPGDFNQALMDIGARICRPNKANCIGCPLSDFCKASALGTPNQYPTRKKKKPIPHIKVVAGLVWFKDTFLILQRPNTAMLGGLWEFPSGKITSASHPSKELQSIMKNEIGLTVTIGEEIGSVHHVYSHFSMTFSVFHCFIEHKESLQSHGPFRWIKPSEIPCYPFPKANHKIFDLLEFSK
ncbi:MAG: A/G-specific adenine glycosylase [Candidatus Marinimicrobia bacterium]|nr:A/G-specific adenine glycosylase [Candidatus Neomarinimicrobiota bacterium]